MHNFVEHNASLGYCLQTIAKPSSKRFSISTQGHGLDRNAVVKWQMLSTKQSTKHNTTHRLSSTL